MKKCLLALALASAAAAGCSSSLVGTWKTDDAAAKPKDLALAFRQIQFQEGKKYLASARTGEKHLFLTGSYEFNGKTLTLKSAGRNDRVFDAVLWWGRELRLTSDGYRQVLRKQ